MEENKLEKIERKQREKEERKAEKLQFLKDKRSKLEEKKVYNEEISAEKAKIRELKGQPFYEKVGEGAVVGIRKGAAMLKEQAPRAARSLQSIGSSLGKEKVPMGSMFGSEGFGGFGSGGKSDSYFGDKGVSFGLGNDKGSKGDNYFGSGGIFGTPAKEKPMVKKKVKKKKTKRKRRKR